MKITLASFLCLCCASIPTIASPVDPASAGAVPLAGTPVDAAYKLAWSDEFNGPALDETKWNFRTDSKMWSTQLPANVSQTNGVLNLNLKKEKAKGKSYTGAGVISKDAFKYGYYEARMKTPPGAGWHSSFWMMRHDGSGSTSGKTTRVELDAIENDSVKPFGYGVNTHKWNPPPHKTYGGKGVKTPDLSAGFHVIGCEYTPETVKYFFDGNLVQTVDARQFPHSDVNIWLTSIASHLGKTTSVDDAKLPAAAQFDYVRFFEKK